MFRTKALKQQRVEGNRKSIDLHVLCVDDDAAARESVRRCLTRRGFQVTLADCGHQAIELSTQHNFDAVILDIVMPDMDGIDVLAALRRLQPSLPIIMLTGLPAISHAYGIGCNQIFFSCVEHGCDGFLEKPFSTNDLVKILLAAIVERRTKTSCLQDRESPATQQTPERGTT